MEKSYLKGCLGAFLGGLIASIPWILVYVYANMIYSILAIFIAWGALKGYQMFKGKVDRKLPVIIVVVSLLSITISTLLIIPLLLLIKEDAGASIANLKLLYANSEFFGALMHDYVISILFTILGISGVVTTTRRQIINDGENADIKISFSNGNIKKDKAKVKEYFVTRNAINKESAIKIDKDADLNMQTVDFLINQCIVFKKDDKYYYSLEEEEIFNKRNKKVVIITTCIVIAIFAFIMFMAFSTSDNNKDDDNSSNTEYNSHIIYDVPSSYKKQVDKNNENSWFYIPKSDLSGDSGYFMVYYLDGDYEFSNEWVETVKNNFTNYENFVKIKNVEDYENKKGLKVSLFDISFKEYDDTVYYIFGNGELGVVEVIDYNKYNSLQKDAKKVVETFKWK